MVKCAVFPQQFKFNLPCYWVDAALGQYAMTFQLELLVTRHRSLNGKVSAHDAWHTEISSSSSVSKCKLWFAIEDT